MHCDCDGNVNLGCGCGEPAALIYYVDADGDGQGDAADAGTPFCADANPQGFVLNNTDSDDAPPIAGCDEVDACNYTIGSDGSVPCEYLDECNDCGGNGIAANSSIRAQAGYVAGTDIDLGAASGDGYSLGSQFQINLEYQDGVDPASVDLWNDWDGSATLPAGTNWHDPEVYTLVIDVNGGLAATTYTGEVLNPALADYSDNLQWTITGWDQTILGGYIDGNRLVVYPANTYRPFNPLLNVNVQEDFSGFIQTELTALIFTGNVEDIGTGTVFSQELLVDACDCDGNVNLGCGCGEPAALIYYADADGDGQGDDADAGTTFCADANTQGFVLNNNDIDDDCVSNIFDCEGTCDGQAVLTDCGCGEAAALTYYADLDGDGLGAGDALSLCADAVTTQVTNNNDTDDDCFSNTFDCEGTCDGQAVVTDCGCGEAAALTYYADLDGDGLGAGDALSLCADAVTTQVTNNNDTDDDCFSNQTGLGYVDSDGDGYTVGDAVTVCLDCSISQEVISASTAAVYGSDASGNVQTFNAVDLPLDVNGNAPVSVTAEGVWSYSYGPTSIYYPYEYGGGSWYSFDLSADGTSIEDGADITGFTTLTFTATDLDNWSDNIYMQISLTYTYPEAVSCVLPSGYAADLGELDCDDNDANASVDLGCGCGEAAAAVGYDCDGTLITPTCGGAVYSYVDPAGNYANSENIQWSLPNNGTDPVTVMFSGVTEGGNWDYFAVYDLADDSFIGVAQGDLTGQVVIGNGNGVIVVFVSDGSVNYAGGSFDAYCVYTDECGVALGDGPGTYYADLDGDGLGAGDALSLCADAVTTEVTNNDDTDDDCFSNTFDCEGTCDGQAVVTDCGCGEAAALTYYADLDGDGLGAGDALSLCADAVTTQVTNNNDTDDDCFSNQTGLGYVDSDGDGYTVGDAVTVCLDCSISQEVISASTAAVYGSDASGNVQTFNAVDLPLDVNGNAPVSVTAEGVWSYSYGPTSIYYPYEYGGGSWYSFDLSADGTSIEDGADITGFTTLTFTATDLDNWSDNIYMQISLTYTYPEAVSCVLPSGYAADLGELDCDDNDANASVDLGCGCGEAAAAVGYDCDGTLITPTCGGAVYSYVDPAGNYANSENIQWSLPNNGTDPVTVMFSGVTEGGNWDYFAVYDLADDSFIGVAQGDLTGQVVIGNGNGVIVVFVSDGSVNYAGGSFDAYCVYTDECGVALGDGPGTYYADLDGDGLGAGDALSLCADAVTTEVTNNDDTDDDCFSNTFDCEGTCDGQAVVTDCGCGEAAALTYYADLDGDGLGAGDALSLCADAVTTEVTNNNDTDDDCFSNQTGLGYVDSDGDGYTVGDAVTVCLDCSISQEVISASTAAVYGSDASGNVQTFNAVDLPLDVNGNAPVSVTAEGVWSYSYGPTSIYYPYEYGGGSWYSFDLSADGTSIEDGADITGFTTLTFTATDLDNWSDNIYMQISLTYTYPEAVSCVLPSGYAADLGELDCDDNDANASVDLGCGCGEAAAAVGYDCDGTLITPTCGGAVYSYVDPAGNYANSENIQWSLPNNGTDPVTVMFSGVTEGGNWDYFAVYDLADDSFIGVAQGDLTGQVVIGNGNGVIVVFVSDGSVNYAGGSFDAYCVYTDECGVALGDGPGTYYADLDGDGLGAGDALSLCADAVTTEVTNNDDTDDDCFSNTFDCEDANGLATTDACGDCVGGNTGLTAGVVGCTDNTFAEYSALATCDPAADQCVTFLNIYNLADCTDPNVIGSETYVSSTTTTWTFNVPAGELATIALSGQVESNWDEMNITDGAGNPIASGIDGLLSGLSYTSSDNTIIVAITGDGSVTYSWGWDVSCFVATPGCTDPLAFNYDALASSDDGTCILAECSTPEVNVTHCSGNSDVTEFLFNEDAAGTPMLIYFNSFVMENNYDELYVISGTDTLNTNYYSNTGAVFVATSSDLRIVFDTDASVGCLSSLNGIPVDFDVYCGSQIFLGCTDSDALNYDADATQDNGTCAYTCDIYVASIVVDALPSCNGEANASASAIIAGAYGGSTYLWSDGQTTSTATGLAAGTYTCTITGEVESADSTVACSSVATVVIDETPTINISGVYC